MFGGPGNRVDDEPGWREKFDEWRASPLWVWERPDWMTESPGVLMLMFVGIALLMVTAVYLVIPPQSLPQGMPGRFVAAAATAPSTIATTTTTISAERRAKRAEKHRSLTPEQQAAYWAWIQVAGNYHDQEVRIDKILAEPPKPRTREWTFAFLSAILAAACLVAAWFLSDARQQRMWSGR
jgi:hypothetical protein